MVACGEGSMGGVCGRGLGGVCGRFHVPPASRVAASSERHESDSYSHTQVVLWSDALRALHFQ